MKAAIVEAAGRVPIFADFQEPRAAEGEVVIDVAAAPLSQVTRARASGTHYSSSTVFPFVVGIDGVGRRRGGTRTYFFLPRPPFGSMAERTVVQESLCVPLPEAMDDVTAAAIAIPAMSSWAALKLRAKLARGEVVLINGATGTSGRLAVQIAKHLGAGKVIATGRNTDTLNALTAVGADVVISLRQEDDALDEAFVREFGGRGVDIILDYLWGPSAERLLAAATKVANTSRPTRFVQIGSAGGPAVSLHYSDLRSHPMEMMGCGLGSVPLALMLQSIAEVFDAATVHEFTIATRAVPLAEVESQWAIDGATTRTVFVVG
ncbi:MAG TPA: zinc-binding alcohol dehydrogenase family protein [Xanthobacteraceae bacterium]|nr:zinc-binding alcohol dehydrogenase family protein [Xanthobacteraceae bacterium]